MNRHVLLGGMLLVVLASSPGLARAQDETKPKPTPPRLIVQKPIVVEAKPVAKPDTPYVGLPAPLSTGAAFTGGGFTSGGFTNGGLRSNLPVVGDTAPVCRASCAKSRYVCLSSDDPTVCDPAYNQCLAACAP